MATICRAKNKATCKVHGMGGPVERLEIDKAQAMRTGNFAEQYNIQLQIDNLTDEDPNAPESPKAGFFGEMGKKIFRKTKFDEIDSKAESIVTILKEHNVFGEAVSDEYIESETAALKGVLQNHALQNEWEPIPITYKEINLRISVSVNVDSKSGQAYISHINAHEYPRKKKSFMDFVTYKGKKHLDYEAINKSLGVLGTPYSTRK